VLKEKRMKAIKKRVGQLYKLVDGKRKASKA
jgi:hypothetical protein